MGLIRFFIYLYVWIIIIDIVLSYFPQFRNAPWARKIRDLADITCKPIRGLMPKGLPFDFSPLVVIIALQLLVVLF